MYTITSNDTRFDITYTKEEIIFLDDNDDTLTWINNALNRRLVDEMVQELTGASNGVL